MIIWIICIFAKTVWYKWSCDVMTIYLLSGPTILVHWSFGNLPLRIFFVALARPFCIFGLLVFLPSSVMIKYMYIFVRGSELPVTRFYFVKVPIHQESRNGDPRLKVYISRTDSCLMIFLTHHGCLKDRPWPRLDKIERSRESHLLISTLGCRY